MNLELVPTFPRIGVTFTDESSGESDSINFLQSIRWGEFKMVDRRDGGPIESHEDVFDYSSTSTGGFDVVDITRYQQIQDSTLADGKAAAAALLLGRGVFAGPTNVLPAQVQRGFLEDLPSPSGETIGATISGTNNERARLTIPVDIQPEILIHKQQIDVKAVRFDLDTLQAICLPARVTGVVQSPDKTHSAYRGVRVNNLFSQLRFETTAYISTTLEPEGVISRNILSNPESFSTDAIWDASIRGDMGGDLFIQGSRGNLFEQGAAELAETLQNVLTIARPIIVLALVGIGIYAFIKIVPPLVSRRRN
jgi:hypothetical protein